MKISVLIIAHNEEKHIAECIESILSQTKKPNEVILIAHNCIDKTIEIAKTYPINVVTFDGTPGIVNARLEGLNHITGDAILCIDGDSLASNNWIEIMTKTLNNNVLVGSYIKYRGTFFGDLSNIWNKYFCVSKNKRATRWIWGAGFAFWGKDIELIKKYLEESIILSSKLNLSRNPDDYWLTLFMSKHGNLEVTNKTFVISNTKEISLKTMRMRNKENLRNGNIIRKYLS